MLGNKAVGPTLAVGDLERAREFYERTLGLEPLQEQDDGVLYRSGTGALLVYRSAYAGTNKATAATWAVGGDLDAVVDELRSKGVAFERYDDLPGVTREGDVHTIGEQRGVWFKDPDGNILSLVDMEL